MRAGSLSAEGRLFERGKYLAEAAPEIYGGKHLSACGRNFTRPIARNGSGTGIEAEISAKSETR